MTTLDIETWPRTLLTLADWDEIPISRSHHVECVEGVLIVAPKPSGRHQKIGQHLATALDSQLPPELVTVPDVDVVLGPVPLTVRAPDVIVVSTSRYETNPPRYDADDVQLAVEVISPGSSRTDRVMKASEYADAGIPTYWVLDGDPSVLTVYVLESGVYRTLGEFTGIVHLPVAGHVVQVDLDDLARR